MPPVNSVFNCPNCRQPITVPVEQVFDASAEPGAKQRFLRGAFNSFQCPACGLRSAVSLPLVYHDLGKELLLTFVPMELGLPSVEAEKALGRLTKQVIDRIPPEQRKGYLLRPQTAISLQGMVERVLEADGVTKEMLEAQRATLGLIQELLAASDEALPELVRQHDGKLDYEFFEILTATAQQAAAQGNSAEAQKRLALRARLLELSSVGKRVQAQTAAQAQALEAAAQSLSATGEGLTREKFLELVINAKSDEETVALVALARPAADYQFFQLLSERIDAAPGAEHERLFKLRETVLKATQDVDASARARVEEAAEIIRALLSARDVDAAIREMLPAIDETLLAVLSANLEAANQAGRKDIAERLKTLGDKIMATLQASAPPEFKFINDLLALESDEEVSAMLQNRSAEVTEQLIAAMEYVAEDLRRAGQVGAADRIGALRQMAQKQALAAKWTK